MSPKTQYTHESWAKTSCFAFKKVDGIVNDPSLEDLSYEEEEYNGEEEYNEGGNDADDYEDEEDEDDLDEEEDSEMEEEDSGEVEKEVVKVKEEEEEDDVEDNGDDEDDGDKASWEERNYGTEVSKAHVKKQNEARSFDDENDVHIEKVRKLVLGWDDPEDWRKWISPPTSPRIARAE
jgi:hypothetical protein